MNRWLNLHMSSIQIAKHAKMCRDIDRQGYATSLLLL